MDDSIYVRKEAFRVQLVGNSKQDLISVIVPDESSMFTMGEGSAIEQAIKKAISWVERLYGVASDYKVVSASESDDILLKIK